MFRRVLYEEWHATVPILAFLLTFGVFLYFVVRTLRMKRSKVDYMAGLPLDNGKHLPEQKQNHE